MKLITLLVVIAGVIALAQLAKVGQLTSLIRNKREEDISAADTRLNGGLFVAFMVAFYASFIFLIMRYGDYNPPAASAHGESYDTLMNFNMYIIMAVFFLVNSALFMFANKYRFDKERKARFFAHDNRLELIWTVIPSIVLAVIIIYGLRTWNEMTGDARTMRCAWRSILSSSTGRHATPVRMVNLDWRITTSSRRQTHWAL